MNEILRLGPDHLAGYLAVAACLFAIGVIACITRRNAVGFLMGVELMFNAAGLNAVAYARFRDAHVAGDGQILALFLIVLAAAEAAVALALVFSVYRSFRDIDLDQTTQLNGTAGSDPAPTVAEAHA